MNCAAPGCRLPAKVRGMCVADYRKARRRAGLEGKSKREHRLCSRCPQRFEVLASSRRELCGDCRDVLTQEERLLWA